MTRKQIDYYLKMLSARVLYIYLHGNIHTTPQDIGGGIEERK